jgi:predicted O-linked N-acetylglucosamine transferase (SPINDLY family)
MLAVPHTILWVKQVSGGHRNFESARICESVNPVLQNDYHAQRRFLDHAVSYGVSTGRIFFFAERLPPLQYHQSYAAIDLILDTPFYNAHSTAIDALWLGM